MQSSTEKQGEKRRPSSVINANKEENNRMGKTRDLFKKLEIPREISCKDGLDKGQKWYGPNRSRRY